MKSALLIIDVQSGIFDSEKSPFDSEIIVNKIRALTEAARSHGDMIVYIQHEMAGVVEYASPQWQLYSKLEDKDNDLKIRKTTPDSFFNTELRGKLQLNEITNLTICGYSSDFCIDRTTFKAASLGYEVLLVKDGHTTHDKAHLSANKIIEHHNQILSMHPLVSLANTIDIIKG